MLRLLRRSLAAASFLMLLPTVALWIRGHWRGHELLFDTYAVVPASTPDPYQLDQNYLYHDERAEDREVRKEREARARTNRRTNCHYQISLANGGVCLSWWVYEVRTYPQAPGFASYSYIGDPLEFGGTDGAMSFNAGKHWGFAQIDEAYSGGASGGAHDASRERIVLFPLWAVATLFAIAPPFWLVGLYRRQRLTAIRRRQRKCTGCGYDLRASPQRCPECGRPADGSSSGSMPGWGRELLPLCIGALLLFAVGGSGYLLISKRLAGMGRLYADDKARVAAAEAAETAIMSNDAAALRAALAIAPVYGPKETAQLLRGLAGERDKAELACVLLDTCADVSNLPGAILHEATLDKNLILARALIEKGVNVNSPGDAPDDRPPLASAIASGESEEGMELIELLLKKGADPSGRTDPKAWTLLHILAHDRDLYPNRVRIAEMLIAKGADVNATADANEITPLYLAPNDSLDPFVQLLKSKGAKRSAKTVDQDQSSHLSH